MSRLDQHVGQVRFKLTLATFVKTLPYAGTMLATALFIVIAVEHLSEWVLPRPHIWFWIGVGVTIAASLAYSIVRRPSTRQAAVAIDERLGLKEKFSTALYVRSSRDPFAAAAVRDAEQAAASAKLGDKFPIEFPTRWATRLFAAVTIAVVAMYLPHYSLVGAASETPKKVASHDVTRPAAEQMAREAIAQAEAAPREVMEDEHVKMAVGEMQRRLDEHAADPARTQQKAQDLLKEIASIKQKIADTNKYVTEVNELNAMKNIDEPAPDEIGPVADAHRALAQGKLDEAVKDLQETVKDFDKMDKKEQEKAADQMQKLAQQVAQKANDPAVQKEVQKQLEANGVDPGMAKQISDKMKDAADGDKQAQQQLQQMANQAIQQANQQQGMSPQQQQKVANAIKNAMQNGQQKTNAQQSAQQMAQTTQALAQAMKQAAQQGNQGQGQQQQANAKQGQGQGNQGQGQKQGQGQGQGQQAQAQPGQGQAPGQGQGQGQGPSPQQQMQQQVAQLGAMAKDAQAVAAAQQAAQGQGQGQQGQGQGQGAGQGQPQANGQWGQGQQGQGQGNQGNPQQGNQGGPQGAALAAAGGRRPDPTVAPFGTKIEYSESQTIEGGKIIANSFIKAPTVVGQSKMTLGTAIDSATKDDAGEVETDRIPRSAQKAVKDYFDTLKQDQK